MRCGLLLLARRMATNCLLSLLQIYVVFFNSLALAAAVVLLVVVSVATQAVARIHLNPW